MKTLSDALKTEQEALSATPYIRIFFPALNGGIHYSHRLLTLEHHEEAYRDRATVILRNDDRVFSVVDLVGEELRIAYGHYTGNNVAEPDGDNGGNEYSYAPTLWVKSQHLHSMEGRLYCILNCEGMWMLLRELRYLVLGAAPDYTGEYGGTQTIYALIDLILTEAGLSLDAIGDQSDGIVDAFQPYFSVNNIPYETAAALIYRLIWMTKCYLRAQAGKAFKVVYPQASDAANQTYYSDQAHYFREHTEKVNLLIPNSIAVFCNQDVDGSWDNLITGTAKDQDDIDRYTEVLELFIAASITNQTDADNRAAAILSRIKAEQLAGRLIVPHDASVELYDRVEVYDRRGT